MTVELAGVFADKLVTLAKLLGHNWYVSPVAGGYGSYGGGVDGILVPGLSGQASRKSL